MANALLGVALLWHPLHASSARISVTPGSGRGTVVLRVFAQDFPPRSDSAAALQYLRNRFTLFDGTRRLDLVLERQRITGDTQTLELSFTRPGRCERLRVWHAVLSERFSDQVNLVQVYCGRRVSHLIFSPGEGPKGL